MNAKEAAKLLGVHYKTVLNMINDGRLAATKNESGDWEISEQDILAREQRIEDKQAEAILLYQAVSMVERKAKRAIQDAKDELVNAGRQLTVSARDGKELNKAILEVKAAIYNFEIAIGLQELLVGIGNNANSSMEDLAKEVIIEWTGEDN